MPLDDDRLTCAAAFVARLFTVSRHKPAGLAPSRCRRPVCRHRQLLEQAVAGAVAAGLVDRRWTDDGLVLLTDKGPRRGRGQRLLNPAPLTAQRGKLHIAPGAQDVPFRDCFLSPPRDAAIAA